MRIDDETVLKYGDQQILIRYKDCIGKLGDLIDITYSVNVSKNRNEYCFVIHLKYDIDNHKMIEVYGKKVGLRYNLFIEKYYNERNFVDV